MRQIPLSCEYLVVKKIYPYFVCCCEANTLFCVLFLRQITRFCECLVVRQIPLSCERLVVRQMPLSCECLVFEANTPIL